MSKEPIPKRAIFSIIAGGVILILSDWFELALGIVMIFGSVTIAVACWVWLGNQGWWFSIPLIALNLAWTGAGVWLVRNPESILSRRLPWREEIDGPPSDGQSEIDAEITQLAKPTRVVDGVLFDPSKPE